MAVDKKKLKLVFEFLGQIICIEKLFFSVILWVGLSVPFLTITQILRAIIYIIYYIIYYTCHNTHVSFLFCFEQTDGKEMKRKKIK